MSRLDRILAGGLFAAGLAVVVGYGVSHSAQAQDATDGPGPNLVIEVAGTANGTVVIDLLPDVAPQHVAQVTALATEGAYDNVVFHRVIDGFMAQTGDVANGKAGGDLSMAGMGGSDKPDLPAEFSDISFQRGIVGMARSQDPNSANSQFFIMFAPGDFLDGQYTVVGRVISGMEVVDAIQRGEPPATPDVMTRVTVQP
ncbi:MAG: peptidylprolyl isomerase [Tabrizicola sp.]|uniref:peptidylprolyl isomerase n=1 Tax=Tabrizicola sp. TaxID=2005166 RepID=UPI002736F4EB|nr:peptidylprolyl isomerase [Tabrizicola sp.]MDP3264576.1 peptidylprolyl isomerase [Tabrizicola sp.]MDP3649444.1 peptidylprolyl isomerase [Paracoccaceae bacterium]